MTEQINLFAEDKNMQRVMKKQSTGKKVTQHEALTALAGMKGTVDLIADDVQTMAQQLQLLEYRMDLLTMNQRTLISVLFNKGTVTEDEMKEQWDKELEKQRQAEQEHAEAAAKAQEEQQDEADAAETVKRESADTAYYKMLAERVAESDMDEDRKRYFQTLLQDQAAQESAAIELRKEGIDLTAEVTDE